jgi:hypothetical protein
MCLRFVYLLVVGAFSWLRLVGREECWKDAEILLLRHQLGVLQRQQVRKPRLSWADRGLIAALTSVIPRAHEREDDFWSLRIRSCGGIAICCAAGGPPSAVRGGQVARSPDAISVGWSCG